MDVRNTAIRIDKRLVGSLVLSLLLMDPLLAGRLIAGSDHRLADAVEHKDKRAVSLLLREHVPVNDPQGDGATALHWAAHWDDVETADLLLRAGANVNAKTDLGVTPLYLAAEIASAAMTQKLLSAGANPNVAADTGVSPLMLAARAGSVPTAQALLAHKADVNAKENRSGQTALMWAVAQGRSRLVQLLLEHGADVHARTKSFVKVLNRGGSQLYDDFSAVADVPSGESTALLFAASRGQIDCAKGLLEFGANVNDTGPDGNSALVVAAHSGQGAFAAFLLDRGANPNTDGAGYTVLHAAVLRGDLELLKSALAHGANPNVQLKNGTPYRRQSADFYLPASVIGATPLLLAAKYASADMIRVLVASGAKLEAVYKDGTTPLIEAANATDNKRQAESEFLTRKREDDERDSFEAVKALLDLGANVGAINEAGNTALHIAASGRSNTIIQLLADRGANLNVKNKRGQTPLAVALGGGGRRGAVGGSISDIPAVGSPQPNTTADLLRKLGAKEPQ